MEKHYIIPIFIPYCGNNDNFVLNYQKKTNAKILKKDIKKTIEEYLKSLEDKSANVELYFYGGNFFTISKKKQIDLLELANEYLKSGDVNSIQVSTRANDIDRDSLKLLKKYKVKTVELIIYSSNDYILNKINCSYSFSDVKKACKKLRWNGFKINFQMMVGLYESTRLDEINTAKALIKLKPKLVKLHPVMVLKNTNLEALFNSKDYSPLPLVQAVEICKDIIDIFASKNIDTDEFAIPENSKDEIVAGPYHVDFRSLVESAMWYDSIISKIKKLNTKVKEVEVTVNPLDSEFVIGYQKENVLKLKDVYDVDLVLKQDESIKQGKSKIEITKTYDDFFND